MTVLLDTCALIWLAADWSHFSPTARQTIVNSTTELRVSAFSAVEIGLIEKRRTVQFGQDARDWFQAVLEIGGIKVLPVTWQIGIASTRLPPIHSDPADRIIVATGLAWKIPIVTPDAHIAAYPSVNVIW